MAREQRFYPRSEPDLAVWLEHFNLILANQAAEYGVSEEQRSEFKGRFMAFLESRDALEEARAFLRHAQTTKDEAKASVVEYMTLLARQVRGNPDVTPAQRRLLGLSSGEPTPTFSALEPPTDLRALDRVHGSILLRWKHGANPRGTHYAIERTLDGVNWETIGFTRTSSFRVLASQLGPRTWFRLVAHRRKLSSVPSKTIGVGALRVA